MVKFSQLSFHSHLRPQIPTPPINAPVVLLVAAVESEIAMPVAVRLPIFEIAVPLILTVSTIIS